MLEQGKCMIPRRRNTAFTLIEVLLVVVIMAVLAGSILPRFLGTADDAKTSSLKHNLHVIEAQLEIYRAQHLNQYPTIQDNALPQLTGATNAAGEIGASGPGYPFAVRHRAAHNPLTGQEGAAVAVPGRNPRAWSVRSAAGNDQSTGAFCRTTQYYQ